MEERKVVVLNSGGFDSVVLCHHLKKSLEKEACIYGLHFLYGARNEKEQLEAVRKVQEKTGITTDVIELPKFWWTKGKFYEEERENGYLEYRNLVFLAYAVSYAESKGADKIYLATYGTVGFSDTNSEFMSGLNNAIKQSGIEIVTPFSGLDGKYKLIPYAIDYGVMLGDYFSCDTPKNGEPCGECGDCKELEIVNNVLKIDEPFKAFYQFKKYDGVLFEHLMEKSASHPYEIRALINNDCQLRCEHCFYGNTSFGATLPKEDYLKYLIDGIETIGFKSVHFSGKEPLFNEDIFYYLDNLKGKVENMSLVTNGINLPKFAERLSRYNLEKVMVSVDPAQGIRKTNMSVAEKGIEACEKYGIPVELSIDLTEENYLKLGDFMIETLKKHKGIKYVYLRTLRTVGNQTKLQDIDLGVVIGLLETLGMLTSRYHFTLNVGIEYLKQLKGLYGSLVYSLDRNYAMKLRNNVTIIVERYCARYTDTYTITSDGFVLGCAMEVSQSDYYLKSIGNVKDNSWSELLEKGKKIASTCNRCYVGESEKVCSFRYLKST